MQETVRLILRDVEQTDFCDIHEYASDIETTYFLGWGPNHEEATRSFMNAWFERDIKTPRRDYHFAVCRKDDGVFVGVVWINIEENMQTSSLGWVIKKKFWRNGYASEAAAALLEYCFCELKLHRVFAKCVTENTASYKVMEKIGMQREAFFRESTMLHSKWRDEFLYAVLKKDWEVKNIVQIE
jgi:[ribosomal protein S5]-alanine N-acetyltransferase